MSALLALALVLQQAPEAAVTLAFEQPAAAETLLHVRGLARPQAAEVRRDGREIVVQLPGLAPEGLAVPPAVPPVEDLRLRSSGGQLELRLRCDPAIALEVRHTDDALQLVLRGTAGAGNGAARADFPELYRSLFPAGMLSEPAVGTEEAAPETEEGQPEPGRDRDGLNLGPISMRPALLVSYVDGENTLEDAQPVRDRYVQIEPRLGLAATVQLLGGRLRASYQPAIRRGSRFPLTRRISHDFDAALQQPLGSALTLRGSGHHARGVLETNEVDPGREYFFGLGAFRRWRYGAGLRFETGGRFDLDVSGALDQLRFDEAAAFFPYDERSAIGELGYDLTPSVRAGLGYVWSEVPRSAVPDRPEAASRAQGLRLALTGDLPQMQGELSVAYQRREHPEAGAGGERFEGVVAGARLSRELRPGATLTLSLSRFTTLSAFEGNGFYVSNMAEAVVTLPIPLGLSLRGGVGLQRNAYEVDAAALGRPRRDTLRGWTAGLGRAFTRWAFARVDYRSDRRDSNLDAFDNRTHTLIAQLGVGWLGGGTESR